ncbi:MAG TPA: beta-propeller fold lactonase family protein [Candidatus Angelobacter sp.]|nr:beta-propeller fold lactonase family protein [Candidatus Angelobacter sp.]
MKALLRALWLLTALAVAGCGGSSSKPVTAAFLYAIGQGTNAIFQFQEQTTGQLAALSVFTVNTSPRPVAMALHPSKNFVYVANETSNVVSGYSVDHNTGILTPLGNALPPTPTGNSPVALGVNSGGQFLYVLNQVDATISTFGIDARGLLVAAGTTPVPASPQNLVVSPTAGFLYVTSGSPATTITGFSIAANGALTPVAGPFTSGTGIAGMTIDSKGQFLFAADSGNNTVLSFTIGANGALAPVAGSPFATSGTQPVSIAVDATTKFLYTANAGSDNIDAFTLNNGALTAVSGSPFASFPTATTKPQPSFAVIDPTNTFLYVANKGTGNTSGFSINLADGTLTALANSPFGANGSQGLLITK